MVGCRSDCLVDWAFTCNTFQSAIETYSICSAQCGDGKKASTEQCDNGNKTGCIHNCQPDFGFTCVVDPAAPAGQPASVCSSTCGDNKLASDEQCDNSNKTGCLHNCQPDYGYYCSVDPSSPVGKPYSLCQTKCGDYIVAGNEACDNGRQAGCPNCMVIVGYACSGTPSNCVLTSICGDKIINGT